jgi:ketopantoate hydroxymethyltransferase
VLAQVGATIEDAMRRYVESIETGRYPAAEHAYSLRLTAADAASRR